MLKVLHKLTVHMDDRHLVPQIEAVQGDANTRTVELTMCSEGEPWIAPQDASVSVAYRKSDGTSGRYDRLPNGAFACEVQNDTVTVVLAPQVLTAPGEVKMAVIFMEPDTMNQLAAFPLDVMVAPNPAAGEMISNDYYNYSTLEQINDALNQLNQELVARDRFKVFVTTDSQGNYTADYGYTRISEAINAGRDCYCQYGFHLLPLICRQAGMCWFSAVSNGQEINVIITDYDVRIDCRKVEQAPLQIAVSGNEADGYTVDKTWEEIQSADRLYQPLRCVLNESTFERLEMPMFMLQQGVYYFAAVLRQKEYLVTIAHVDDGSVAVQMTVKNLLAGDAWNVKKIYLHTSLEKQESIAVNAFVDGDDSGIYLDNYLTSGDTLIRGVADGAKDTDAVNLKQLKTLEEKVNEELDARTTEIYANLESTTPTVTVMQTDTGVTVTATDKNGTTTATLGNGKDGEKGDTGATGPQGPQGEKGDSYTLTDTDKAEIAEMVDAAAATPDYIVAEAERVARNVQATRTAKSLVFPVMSDMHLFDGSDTLSHPASLLSAQYAGMGVAELRKRIHIDFVGFLGDYTYGGENCTAAQIMADITAFKKTTDRASKEIWCVGNHDLNRVATRDRLLTLDELYGHIGANSDGVKPFSEIERGYGYLDFENQKIRIIYLNTCDTSDLSTTDGVKAESEWVGPAQMQWLADTALDFSDKENPSAWGIVIVGHHPLHYNKPCYGYVMEILEAYRDGKSGSVDDTKNGAAHTVSFDFTGVAERAEIICNIHGHNHNCGYSKISSTTYKGTTAVQPWLWRLCASHVCADRYNSGYGNAATDVQRENYGEVDASGNPVYHYKETGTAKATSFCVVNIDRKNKKIYAHIFGAGKDRVISYDEEYVPAEYTIGVTVENCTASADNPATITENGTATLTFAANDGYALPNAVTVTGASYIWDKESGTLVLSAPAGAVEVSVAAVEVAVEPAYTNQIPISTNADGNIYDGDGWKEGYRLSSSGADTTGSGYGVTGYIPIGIGSSATALGEQVVYIANAECTVEANTRIAVYGADKSFVGVIAATQMGDGILQSNINIPYEVDDNGYMKSIDLTNYTWNRKNAGIAEVAFFRFCGKGLDGDTIITVNEPIE